MCPRCSDTTTRHSQAWCGGISECPECGGIAYWIEEPPDWDTEQIERRAEGIRQIEAEQKRQEEELRRRISDPSRLP